MEAFLRRTVDWEQEKQRIILQQEMDKAKAVEM